MHTIVVLNSEPTKRIPLILWFEAILRALRTEITL